MSVNTTFRNALINQLMQFVAEIESNKDGVILAQGPSPTSGKGRLSYRNSDKEIFITFETRPLPRCPVGSKAKIVTSSPPDAHLVGESVTIVATTYDDSRWWYTVQRVAETTGKRMIDWIEECHLEIDSSGLKAHPFE